MGRACLLTMDLRKEAQVGESDTDSREQSPKGRAQDGEEGWEGRGNLEQKA